MVHATHAHTHAAATAAAPARPALAALAHVDSALLCSALLSLCSPPCLFLPRLSTFSSSKHRQRRCHRGPLQASLRRRLLVLADSLPLLQLPPRLAAILG